MWQRLYKNFSPRMMDRAMALMVALVEPQADDIQLSLLICGESEAGSLPDR